MSRMRGWFGQLAIVLACAGFAGLGQAEELAIQSFNGSGRLTFNELTSATNYRIEWASSPTGPWTNFASAYGAWDYIPAVGSGIVTCAMPVFYRVLASVTNGVLTFDAAGDLAFGTVGVGNTATRTLTLRNRGNVPLTVTGISYPDGFSGAWSGVIPAGYQQDVTVTFTPTESAEYGGAISVYSDSAVGSGTLAVTGTGVRQLYLVIDLGAGPSASTYPVSYLANVPGGGWSDDYKTTKLVLRRLPATTNAFTMGSPVGELGRQADETQHAVALSQGFYVGVFEVTQRQWERVTGAWPSYFTDVVYRDARPVEQVSYNAIRGSSAGAGWPASSGVDNTSFLGKLRARTGLAFDLPTESQWEYACRAGTDTALNSGYNLTSTASDTRMAEVGRYYYNGGLGAVRGDNTNKGSAKVGSYLANQWGLYDMHGNVWEWCLDWYETYPGYVTDPKGAASGLYRLRRGGGWEFDANYCRSAFRNSGSPAGVNSSIGFRVKVPSGQ